MLANNLPSVEQLRASYRAKVEYHQRAKELQIERELDAIIDWVVGHANDGNPQPVVVDVGSEDKALAIVNRLQVYSSWPAAAFSRVRRCPARCDCTVEGGCTWWVSCEPFWAEK